MDGVTKSATQLFFQNSLPEVIRKLRSSNGREDEMIDQLIADTKKEISSSVQSVKVAAIQKAAYFHMLGYSATYANFNTIEIMADSFFGNKRTAYMAACMTFNEKTDVIPLMTALLKRDLTSSNQYECGLALYCIASICTPDLAQDLVGDVVNLLSHPRAYVRKKAILALYKIFLQYPESLRPVYPKLKQKLDDNSEYSDGDASVRGAVVSVLCELARRNPSNFLGLAVPFYSLLSNVHSNWTLIKVIKVFGYFAPFEPRLGKKLVDPLTNLIETTGAKSVQYECLLAVANGLHKVPSLTKLAAQKLKVFVEDSDQNLKYLGLHALALMSVHSAKLIADQREIVMRCLDDADITVRCKALEILVNLATGKNIMSMLNCILDHSIRSPPDEKWSNCVVATVVEMASTDDYGLIQDFEWYLGLLLDLSLLPLSEFLHGDLLEREIVSILTRVNGVRAFGVESLSHMLKNKHLLTCNTQLSNQWMTLRAAAFACGEYPHWLASKRETCELLLAEDLSRFPDVQAACVAAVGKILAFTHRPCDRHVHLCNGEEEGTLPVDPTTLEDLLQLIAADPADGDGDGDGGSGGGAKMSALSAAQRSMYPSVQEAANLVRLHVDSHFECELYGRELLAVAEGAQEALEVPETLRMDVPFCENISALMLLSDSEGSADSLSSDDDNFDMEYRIEQQLLSNKKRREEVDAFYLKDMRAAPPGAADHVEADAAAAAAVAAAAPLAKAKEDAHTAGAYKHRFRKGKPANDKSYAINRDLSRPANYIGAAPSRSKRSLHTEEDKATKMLRNIDVTRALTADERLPEVVPYGAATAPSEPVAVPPVVLLDEDSLRVWFYIDGCKVHRDGFHLRCQVEVSNLSLSTSLHNVQLQLSRDASAAVTAATVQLVGAEESGKNDEGSADGAITVAEKIKTACTERKNMTLRLSELPSSFADPLTLTLAFTRDKKSVAETLHLPLRYQYFNKHVPVPITSKDFIGVLEEHLSDAAALSAFFPCSKPQIPLFVSAVGKSLSLTPVDVFKDTVTLYGSLHGKKTGGPLTHVAVLLREGNEGDEKGLVVAVKCSYVPLAESLILEAAEILQNTLIAV